MTRLCAPVVSHLVVGLCDQLLEGVERQRDGPQRQVGDDHGLPMPVHEGAPEEHAVEGGLGPEPPRPRPSRRPVLDQDGARHEGQALPGGEVAAGGFNGA